MNNLTKITTLLLAVSIFSTVYSDPSGSEYELIPMLKNYSNPNDSTEFILTALSPVWDKPFMLTEGYDTVRIKVRNNNPWTGEGLKFIKDPGGQSEGVFGYAKYKLSVVNDDVEYSVDLDYRDENCGYYDGFLTKGHAIDVYFRFDLAENEFQFNSYTNPPDTSWEDVASFTIWDFKDVAPRGTGKFEPYPPENLSVNEIIPNVKHRLTWSHHSPADDYWEKYYIYRSITSIYPPNYILIDSALSTATTYLDIDLAVGTGQTVYYKVKAKNTSALSDFSNEAPEYSGPTGTPQTPSNFHVTWVTCTGGWNPKLEWNLITGDPRIHGYKLHRSFDGSTGTYSLRATVNSSTSYFIDTQIIKSSTTKNSDYVHFKLQSYTYEQVPEEGPLYSGYAGPLACRYDEDGGYMPKQQANKDQVLPDKYLLNQNYPNPFNPVTSIRYALPKSSDVTLKIIDISGREVQTIVRNTQLAGYYEVQWNGQDESGRLANTGTYFAHLQAGEFSKVIKMVYLR